MYSAKNARFRGFSFIEVMVVVIIIGILAGAVTISARHFLDKAKRNRAQADLSTLKSALTAFYADNGYYPTNDEGLAVLAPKYIDKIENDPWGKPYQYNQPGKSGPYEILCPGANEIELTSDVSAASPIGDPAPPPASAGHQ